MDGSGNVYVAGYYTNSTGNATTVTDFAGNTLNGKASASSVDAYVAKLDSSGIQQWMVTFGGAGGDSVAAITFDGSGNVYVIGSFSNSSGNANAVTDFVGNVLNGRSSSTTTDAFVAKLNSSGVQQWIKTLGGTSSESGDAIAVDGSGNVYVSGGYYNSSGNANSTVDFAGNALNGKKSAATGDVYVAKLNASGVQQWIRTLGGTGGENAIDIIVDSSGNVFASGTFVNASTNSYGVIDFAGNALNGTSSSYGRDAFLVKFDASGNTTWIKALGASGGDTPGGLALDSGGNIYIGIVNVTLSLLKLNSSGTQQWAKTMTGPGGISSVSIAVDSSTNIYVTGYYKNSSTNTEGVTDFAGATLLGKTTTDSNEIYVAKLNSSGTQQWIKTLGGTSSDSPTYVGVDSSNNVYVSGTYKNTLANGDTGTDFLGNNLPGKTATESYEGFVTKFP